MKLSICIPTFNRSKFIGQTLLSFVDQCKAYENEIEIVIVDGSPNDETLKELSGLMKTNSFIKYYKSPNSGAAPSNKGFDSDCDYAVKMSVGNYCWLMTDDDLFNENAVSTVMEQLDSDYAMVIASVVVENENFTKTLISKRPEFKKNVVYEKSEINELASTQCNHLTFVGAVIIKKSYWMSVDKEKYYGTGFIHVGVIFDAELPGKVLCLSEPIVRIRYGNALWSARSLEIWLFRWPELIWSFKTLSVQAKNAVVPQFPFKNLKLLFYFRALGGYNFPTYKTMIKKHLSPSARIVALLIAIFPTYLANSMSLFYFGYFPGKREGSMLNIYDLINNKNSSLLGRQLFKRYT